MKKLLLVLLLLLAACAPKPSYRMIDGSSAFVYPSGGQVLLALDSGEYALTGPHLPDGCYRLTPGKPGTAEWVGEVCP